jgi:hypothetical protein
MSEMAFIGATATRIINEVKGVNRVVYDISVIAPSRSLSWKRPFAPCASTVEKNSQDDVGFRKPRSSFRCQADEAGSKQGDGRCV